MASLQLANEDEEDRYEVGDVEGDERKGNEGVEGGVGADIDSGEEGTDDTDKDEGVERDFELGMDLNMLAF